MTRPKQSRGKSAETAVFDEVACWRSDLNSFVDRRAFEACIVGPRRAGKSKMPKAFAAEIDDDTT